MIFFTFKRFLSGIFLIFLLSSLSSCSKFEGEQTVPAYIRIDTIGLKITDLMQGSSSASISDAWIYVDDQLVGAFELPCTIPVLHQSICRVTVKPGIKLNGLINLRSAFPLFSDIVKDVMLTPDSITTLGSNLPGSHLKVLFTEYSPNTTIKLVEAFEDASFVFDTTLKSQITMGLTPTGSADVFEGDHSGMVTLSDSITYFEMCTREELTLPGLGTPVFVEMDYKTSVPVTIGVYAYSNSTIVQYPLMVLTEMPEWHKIYINLTPIISDTYDALTYKVFIGASRASTDPSGTLFLDNVKIIHL